MRVRLLGQEQVDEGGHMRALIFAMVALVCSFSVLAQSPETGLRADLEGLHAKWMKAYYGGDTATMDQLEADNLVLVMPTGFIWVKSGPRTEKQLAFDPQTECTLTDVSVRQFGDTAILTGLLRTKSAKENSQEGTTVVFVRNSGKWKIASAQWTSVADSQ